jgi:predicted O-linked N-acetylglucosamine transferase (SPINDLY family)
MSRDLGIDIAVDLKGFTADARTGIFAHRCAPIQVNYLGHPGSMAAPYMDYIVADKILIPPNSQADYSEKVVYMPHSYQVNDSKRPISDKVFTRIDAGLPEHGFVFCCFNNSYKIQPQTFDIWMRLLKCVEGSVLWLFEDNPSAAQNLRQEAQTRGVDPCRLVFAARLELSEHLARQRLADLFLDTLPYNAHTTASDALWAGLPVLTLMGQSFAARVAASLLHAMDLPELITETENDYVSKAIELAKHPELRHQLKLKIARQRMTSPLFQGQLFAKHLETAFVTMFERHQSGWAPDHIFVAT